MKSALREKVCLIVDCIKALFMIIFIVPIILLIPLKYERGFLSTLGFCGYGFLETLMHWIDDEDST
jgi:hypothetical protein